LERLDFRREEREGVLMKGRIGEGEVVLVNKGRHLSI
jgi:hypothetical protein